MMRNRLLSFVVLFILVISAKGQVKISTSSGGKAAQSSILEVESSDKGFLPPRIWLNDRTMNLNGGAPVDGMVVFNTNFGWGAGGLCIWHDGKWNKLSDGMSSLPTSYVRLSQVGQQFINGNNVFNWTALLGSQWPSGDEAMWVSGDQITIRRAGIYVITATADIYKPGSSTAVVERNLFITRNNIQIAGTGAYFYQDFNFNVSAMAYCDIGDVIRIGFYNGGSVTLKTYSSQCTIVRLPSNVMQ